MFEDVIRQIFSGIPSWYFMQKNHHADYMMVPELTELTVIDSLHDCIGGYDI